MASSETMTTFRLATINLLVPNNFTLYEEEKHNERGKYLNNINRKECLEYT